MTGETPEKHIEPLITEWLADKPGYFLVEVRIKPTNNVKVFLDGDDGVTIEVCTKLSRLLYANFEETGLFSGADFSLEVSSAGVGEPLLLLRQYLKNIGRHFEVKLIDGGVVEGVLLAADDKGITLESSTGKGKKLVTLVHELTFDQIKSAEVQVKF